MNLFQYKYNYVFKIHTAEDIQEVRAKLPGLPSLTKAQVLTYGVS